jgi:hypothetical protein
VKFIKHLEVLHLFVDFFKGVSPNLLGPDIFKDGFGLPGVVPKISLVGDEFFVFYFVDLAIVVKDTSSRPPHGSSSLSTAQWSSVKKF